MSIQVKKASIKNSLFLAYEYDQSINSTKNIIKTSSDAPIHDDLRDAFSALIPHFAFICEEIKETDCKERLESPEEELSEEHPLLKYKVSGFSIGGQGDSEGVTISGSKRLESGSILNLNTPFLKFEDVKDYVFMPELRESIDILKSEVYEYLEGKQAPSKQPSMNFEEEELAM
jgi:SpoU rRNA methylase family enzyme